LRERSERPTSRARAAASPTQAAVFEGVEDLHSEVAVALFDHLTGRVGVVG